MKRKLNYAFVIIFSIMTIGLTFAQKGVSVLQKGEKGLAPRFLKINQENKISKENYEKLLYNILKIDRAYQFVEVNTETDDLGINHLKVQQYLNGYPVENAFYIIHSKNGFIHSANGEVFKVALVNKNRIFKSSGISPKEALQKAKNFMGGDTFLSEEVENKSAFKKKEAKVYICKNNELDIANLKLAYKFDIYSKKPFNRKKVYIDFHSGNTVFAEALMHSAFEGEKSGSCKHYDKHEEGDQKVKSLAVGKTKTGYYGTKSIDVSGSSGRYLASQTGKRNISVTNLNGRTIGRTNSPPRGGSIISSSSSDGFGKSGNEAYYMAAYWGAERTWDMFKDEFGRSGYNGAGGKINIFVNASDRELTNNAFWVGSWTYFGNASQGTPFTPLDVVSHEIAHGVTQTSAGLVYRNESGAMNEGFSDIFGCYAEYYILNRLDNNTWTMGENISFQRSLSNPKKHRQPDTYRGTNWYSGSGDNGGVHTNSGVLNHWFYILSQGKQGTNDKGSSYNVKGIGIKKAVQVAYRALTRYLTSSSNYSSARNAVISAATDLYGANSCELVATTDAMYAVGIGAKYSGSGCSTTNCAAVKGLIAGNITKSGAQINWTAKPGVTSYRLEYKKASSKAYNNISVNGSSYNLSGLLANTSYQVRATYTCNGQLAPYSTITNFRTKNNSEPPKCNAVTGVKASEITQTSALIFWSSKTGVTSYVTEYKEASSSSYITVNANTNSKILNNLKPETTYNVRIKYTCDSSDGGGNMGCSGLNAYQNYPKIYNSGDKITYQGRKYKCNSNGIYNIPPAGNAYSYLWSDLGSCSTSLSKGFKDSPYSALITFTTLTKGNQDCVPVQNVVVSDILKKGAKVNWSPISGVNTYKLEYKKLSSISYVSLNVSGTSYSFTNLLENSKYNVRIKYICTNGQESPYSTVVNFTTKNTGGGSCANIPAYQNNKSYEKGAKVFFNGNIWEAQIKVWWSPAYGYWTNLGPCSNSGLAKIKYTLFPNPFEGGEITIELNRKTSSNVEIRMTDTSGNILFNTKKTLNTSKYIKVDVPHLNKGAYIIYVNDLSKKLIVK